MFDLKIRKAFKILLRLPSKRNSFYYSIIFIFSFYCLYFYWLSYGVYKDEAGDKILKAVLNFYSTIMSTFPLLYYVIISEERESIIKISKIFNCNQLKNTIIFISFFISLLFIFPPFALIIYYATIRATFFKSVTISFMCPIWLLFNILIMLLITIIFKRGTGLFFSVIYTFLMTISGLFIDKYLSGIYGHLIDFFNHMSPYVYMGTSSISLNINYLFYWFAIYLTGAFVLYLLLSKNLFLKSNFFKRNQCDNHKWKNNLLYQSKRNVLGLLYLHQKHENLNW